jgi:hypothetical protein
MGQTTARALELGAFFDRQYVKRPRRVVSERPGKARDIYRLQYGRGRARRFGERCNEQPGGDEKAE